MIGRSPKFRHMLDQISIAGPTDCTVLILGESGTGKELVAGMIHALSRRAHNALVEVNCAAIPLGLLESELFGHERGAFTGAVVQRIGRFEAANRGTLFLDELGDIPLELQPKLLRFLQEQQFQRLGSTRTIHTDVRLVAATHRNLAAMVEDGNFRADLYYRLKVFPIFLPPLRERRDDIPLLVWYFTDKFATRMNKHIDAIPNAVLDALVQYSWPGNIRELQNFIERAVILSRGAVLEAPLSELTESAQEMTEPVTLRDAERAHIVRTLRDCGGVVAATAARLEVPRTTLFYMMRRLGIPQLGRAPRNRVSPASNGRERSDQPA